MEEVDDYFEGANDFGRHEDAGFGEWVAGQRPSLKRVLRSHESVFTPKMSYVGRAYKGSFGVTRYPSKSRVGYRRFQHVWELQIHELR